MSPRHRPYRPKVKDERVTNDLCLGCYECSQRRVSCDRTSPQCMKCVSKGLQCSGLDLRFRFAEGVAIRGKWAGESVQSLYERSKGLAEWSQGETRRGKGGKPLGDCKTSAMQLAPTASLARHGFILSYEPVPYGVSSWKRQLLVHYSDHIAGEMIAIDGRHNGWRYLILPMAHTDDLVMDAVLTVSAFHIWARAHGKPSADDISFTPPGSSFDSSNADPEILYGRTIQRLKQRQDLARSNLEARQCIIVAILVLLTSVMVNGGDDFPILFNMLDAATNVLGGEDQLSGSELGDFIMRQVRKMRVYAAPLISEQTGSETLSSPSRWQRLFDCLRYCSQREPQHAAAAAYVEDIVQQAHGIYLRQVANDPMCGHTENFTRESISRVELFKNTLEAFPVGSPGKQVLVWAAFIAASDCILEEHKTFFEQFLMEIHNRSGFVNVLKGLELLRYIWTKRDEGVRWTHLLPQAQLFLM
ncbi:hypothetical protein BJX96DRAFT_181522 [Aspergillus floccosus]